jgi:hypothetical protein
MSRRPHRAVLEISRNWRDNICGEGKRKKGEMKTNVKSERKWILIMAENRDIILAFYSWSINCKAVFPSSEPLQINIKII